MARGVPIIAQAVLRNPQNRTFGAADLLIRSDVLRRLFPDALADDEARVGAPGIGASLWHYRVVDIKFTGLKLDRYWHAASGHLAYMAQVHLYNEALGRIQGLTPPAAYLLGRGWKKGVNECTNCVDRLAPVRRDRVARGESLATVATTAVDWVRRVRREGMHWDPRDPTRYPELRPNPSNEQNYPWHSAVAELAQELDDPMLAWQVGLPGRRQAIAAEVERWTDPRFTAATAGVTGSRAAILDRVLAVNRDPEGPAVWPEVIKTEAEVWGEPEAIEFYVDFETVSNLNDDFAGLPEQNGQPLIFMIGCGHLEDGEWKFACFVARDLSIASEADIIESWLAHMEAVRQRLAPGVLKPLVFHWSPAETSSLSAVKSARARSPLRQLSWAEPNWFDFLTRVVKREPVVARGPMGFGLKTVARSLKQHGLIETGWPDGVADGLGAMVAAWTCAAEAAERNCALADLELMQQVRSYNEVDCRVMMEAIRFLRTRVLPVR